MKDPRIKLQETLSERVATNPGYSLRAFARDLEISPQLLSNMMNGKKGFSETMASKVANRLKLNASEKELFCLSSQALFARSKSVKAEAKVRYAHLSEQLETLQATTYLEMDLFKVISNWYHLALIELIKISKKSTSNLSVFSGRLGIIQTEVELALGRLQRLGLITSKNNFWKVNQDTVIADFGVPSEAVRNFHRQVLAKAVKAIDNQTDQERYGSSSLMPIRVKNLGRAKTLIQEFRKNMALEISQYPDGEEIYALSIQFFKVSQNSSHKVQKEIP